ncbi:MAG: ribonuclease P protein component, partial [Paraglaciecola sp.]
VVVGKSGLDKLSNQELLLILNKLWKKLAKRCDTSSSGS